MPFARDQRYAVTWPGRARVEGARRWFDCTVVQVSTGGATVVLEWEPDLDVLRRVLHLRVPNGQEGRDAVHLTGRIVYQLMPRAGQTRVGIRFARAGLLHEELLELLLRLRHL